MDDGGVFDEVGRELDPVAVEAASAAVAVLSAWLADPSVSFADATIRSIASDVDGDEAAGLRFVAAGLTSLGATLLMHLADLADCPPDRLLQAYGEHFAELAASS